MISELVEELRELGMAKYEAQAYVTLVAKGMLNAVELSKQSGVPKGRIYDVLKELEEKGYIFVQPSKKKRETVYRARSPQKIFGELINKRQRELRKLEEEVIPKLQEGFEEKTEVLRREERVWVLKGQDRIYDKLIECINTAKKNVYIVSTEDTTLLGMDRGIAGLVLDRLKNGVKVYQIAEMRKSLLTHANREEVSNAIKLSLDKRCKLRHHPNVVNSILCKDDEVAVLGLSDPVTKKVMTGILIYDEDVTRQFETYFWALWNDKSTMDGKKRMVQLLGKKAKDYLKS